MFFQLRFENKLNATGKSCFVLYSIVVEVELGGLEVGHNCGTVGERNVDGRLERDEERC